MSEKSWRFFPEHLEGERKKEIKYNLATSGKWISLGIKERADYYITEPIFNPDTHKLIFLHKDQDGKTIEIISINPNPSIESKEEAAEFCSMVNEQLAPQLLQDPSVNTEKAFSLFDTLVLAAKYLTGCFDEAIKVENKD